MSKPTKSDDGNDDVKKSEALLDAVLAERRALENVQECQEKLAKARARLAVARRRANEIIRAARKRRRAGAGGDDAD